MAGSSNKIFVGGLPQGVDDNAFREYFEKFGATSDVVVMKDAATGNTRGFGFVTYDDTGSVDAVMDMYKDHQINGKWVEVKRATPKGDSKGSDKGGGKGGGKDSGKGGKPGDWTCPNCSNNVWASKDVCGRCQTPRPQPQSGPDYSQYGMQPNQQFGMPPQQAYGAPPPMQAYGAYGAPPMQAYGQAPPAYGGYPSAAPQAYGAYGAAPAYQQPAYGKGAAPY